MSDAVFAAAIATLLANEGGFVDDPDDPGGATAFGISLRTLRATDPALARELADLNHDGIVDAEDLRLMTRDQAVQYYRRAWWDRFGFATLAGVTVPAKLFDMAVNMGTGQMARCAQRALRACNESCTEDGLWGSKTRQAICAASNVALIAALKSEAAGFYRVLAAEKPELARFLTGWLNRAYS